MTESSRTGGDLRQEQRRIYLGVGRALLFCTVVYASAFLLLPRIAHYPHSLEGRLAFWASANLLVMFWVMIGIFLVSRGRRRSLEDMAGSAYSLPSPKIAVAVAFLQNTVEQAILSGFTHLALILLMGDEAFPLTVGSVLLFGIGRAAFLAAYPRGAGARSFGMAVTMLPSMLAFVLAVATAFARLSS